MKNIFGAIIGCKQIFLQRHICICVMTARKTFFGAKTFLGEEARKRQIWGKQLFWLLSKTQKHFMNVFFDTLTDAVLLEGTNIFSYTCHYDIVMVDDDEGALDCFLCFPFIPRSVS